MEKRLVLCFLWCSVIMGDTTAVHKVIETSTNYTSSDSLQNFSVEICDIQPMKFYRATSVLVVLFIPITIIGNVMVCIVVYISPVFYKQRSYILITSLAVADGLVGAISMPIKAKIQWNHNYFCLPDFVCWIYMLEEVTFSLSSVAHLFAIAVERYISLKYSYQYESIMSHKRLALTIVAIWTFSISCSLLSIVKWTTPFSVSIASQHYMCTHENREFFTLIYIVFFIFPTACMTYIYRFLYKTTAHHIEEISKLDVLNSPQSRERNRRNRYYRMVRSITIVFAVYTLCWIPTVLFIFLTFYFRELFIGMNFHTGWFPVIYFILIHFLPHLNSTINPFIYVISNVEFRHVVYRLICRKPCSSQSLSRSTDRTTSHKSISRREMASLGQKCLNLEETLKERLTQM